MYVTVKDEAFAVILLDYYKDYLVNDLQPMIEENSLEFLGGATQKLKAESENELVSGYKKPVLVLIGVVVLEFLFVILYSFFYPTLNICLLYTSRCV